MKLTKGDISIIRLNAINKGVSDGARNKERDTRFIETVLDKYGVYVGEEYNVAYYSESQKTFNRVFN